MPGFNPTLVRLRQEPSQTQFQICPCFNPTLVRLRQATPASKPLVINVFQSHAGSIEAVLMFDEWHPHMRFQSHAGSIEAAPPSMRSRARSVFQSHAGSIEALPLRLLQGPADLGFNPTLVRLRPVELGWAIRERYRFNPTLVRLRQPGAWAPLERYAGFNPTLVRLRPAGTPGRRSPRRRVSIPRWFD